MKNLNSLSEILVHNLEELYDAEKQQLKSYSNIAEDIGSIDLRAIFRQQKNKIEEKIKRLETAFEILDAKAKTDDCAVMNKLLDKLEAQCKKLEIEEVRNATVVVSMQCISHFKIATYGSMAAFARVLGQDKIAELMHTSMDEEKLLDQQLSWLAIQKINGSANRSIPSNSNWSAAEHV